MKTRVAILISILLISVLFAVPAYSTTGLEDPEIKVFIEGIPVSFDVRPVIEKGRVLVPIRAIFEALGASVEWDSVSNTVYALKDGREVKITVNNKKAFINDAEQLLDVPARNIKGRVLVPLRFSGEAFGVEVKWESKNYVVKMYEKKPVQLTMAQMEKVGNFFEEWNGLGLSMLSDRYLVFRYQRNTQDPTQEPLEKSGIQVLDTQGKIMHNIFDSGWGKNFVHIRDVKLLPDGRLAYTYNFHEGTPKTVFAAYDFKSRETQKIYTYEGECWFSPISSQREVLFDNKNQLVKVTPKGEAASLNNSDYAFGHEPIWSPNGKEIAFGQWSKLYIIGVDGSRKAAYDLPALARYVTWSPDGQYLAYVIHEEDEKDNGLWLAKADGTENKRILKMTGLFYPSWSSDSEKLYTGTLEQIYVLNHTGQILNTMKALGFPAWSNNGQLLLWEKGADFEVWDSVSGKSTPLLTGEEAAEYTGSEGWYKISSLWGKGQEEIYVLSYRNIYKLTLKPK